MRSGARRHDPPLNSLWKMEQRKSQDGERKKGQGLQLTLCKSLKMSETVYCRKLFIESLLLQQRKEDLNKALFEKKFLLLLCQS